MYVVHDLNIKVIILLLLTFKKIVIHIGFEEIVIVFNSNKIVILTLS